MGKEYQELVGMHIYLILIHIFNAIITKWFDGHYYNRFQQTFLESTSHYALQECNMFKRNTLYYCGVYTCHFQNLEVLEVCTPAFRSSYINS